MANNYWVNGYRMEDAARRWYVMEGTKVPGVGAMRSSSTTIPNRMGVLPSVTYAADPFQVALNMMVTDAGGRGGWAQLQANWDSLMAIVRPFRILSNLQWMPDGGSIRYAPARLSGAVDPTFDRGAMTYDTTLVFEVPGGVWKEQSESTMAINNLNGLKGGSAPVSDALFLVSGAPNLIACQDYQTSARLTWSGTPQAGKNLLIEPGEYRASWVTGEVWQHSNQDASFGLDISAQGFALHPDFNGAYLAQATGGAWKVKASRSFA